LDDQVSPSSVRTKMVNAAHSPRLLARPLQNQPRHGLWRVRMLEEAVRAQAVDLAPGKAVRGQQ